LIGRVIEAVTRRSEDAEANGFGCEFLRRRDRKDSRMSLDPSLKVKAGGVSNRSVYTRAERVAKLIADKKKDASKDGALSMAKTRVTKG
jgi:small basic protein (TIGR04137 family)